MKFAICILSLSAVLHATNAGLLPHLNAHHHEHDDVGHYVDGDFHHADVHHSAGIHLGHSSAVIIDGAEQHLDAHPVYHHDGSIVHHDAAVHHHDVHHDDHVVHHTPAAAQIVHHEAIHQVEPVHHVTKVVHHEPHHFLHYTNPVVDHHVVHQNAHIDEHHHAADLHHSELHHGDLHHADLHHHAVDVHHGVDLHHGADLHHGHGYGHAAIVHHAAAPLVHHHHSAPLVHHHHSHAAIVRKIVPSHHHHLTHSHLSLERPGDILAFAKHQLHGKYGKVKITETHY